MKQAKFLLPTLVSPISPMISLCTLFFSFLVRKSLGVDDPQFLACSVPKTCGDVQNITFPFYIQGKQEDYCGQPGFPISCNNNGQSTLNISKNSYIIHKIFYQNQTLRVSNADFSNSNTDCFPLTKNMSFPGIRFDLVPQQSNLHLLYNCSNSSLLHSTDLQSYAGCDGENVLALSEDDPKLGEISKECTTEVVAPVEAYGGQSDPGIREVLRNGFWLKWKARANCNVCEDSGGFCGTEFDANSNYRFRCFCADRPRLVGCNRGRRELLLNAQFGLDGSPFTYEQNVYMVKLAEQAKCYNEMVDLMDKVVLKSLKKLVELSIENCNMFYVAYKNANDAWCVFCRWCPPPSIRRATTTPTTSMPSATTTPKSSPISPPLAPVFSTYSTPRSSSSPPPPTPSSFSKAS